MDLLNIVKGIGEGLIKTLPLGGLIVDTVNNFLPDNLKLPDNPTGNEVQVAISSLPAEAQKELYSKQFEVDITQIKESNSTLRVMLESDAKSTHTTRPYIAKGAFKVVAFSIMLVMSVWAIAVLEKDTQMIDSIMGGWQFVLAVIAPFVTLLLGYFGILKQESKNRLDASNGKSEPTGIASIVKAIRGI